jgi:flagellar biosynthesis/type III secretory pathway protein FliH
MSLSEPHRMNATPWSLDEFVAHDTSLSPPPPAELPVEPSEDVHAVEAMIEQRLAEERARIEADAYARGHTDGERSAQVAVQDALRSALSALGAATASITIHDARWVTNAQENIAALAVSVARHIVQRAIDADPSCVAGLVANALAQYPIDQEITVRLCPDDLAFCRQTIEQERNGARTMRWIGDASIARGGCLTEGRERIIDGRVDTALERVYRAIAQVQA